MELGSFANDSSSTFTLTSEDRTMANTVRFVLNQDPKVKSAGFSIPHPSLDCVNIQVQTTGDPAREVFRDACEELMLINRHVKSVYGKAVAEYKARKMANEAEALKNQMDIETIHFSEHRHISSTKRKHSYDNGSLLLEELIASSDGKYNPIRMFSSDQILKATNNFDGEHSIAADRFIWYKGIIEDRRVLIKKWEGNHPINPDNVYRDIAVTSMMSNHKNVLKLLGCCIEFRNPVLVCEYAETRALNLVDKEGFPLPWSTRLKIAKEIASAVTYLHTGFPRVIINRDINPQNIFLDENGAAKLSSFCLSISIPEGESCVVDEKPVVRGLSIDPNYTGTGLVSENFDVYSFGVTMLFLLAGNVGLEWLDGIIREFGFPFPIYVGELADHFIAVIDPAICYGDNECSTMQVEAFFGLALRCIRFWPEQETPTMIDVAKELKVIEGLVKVPSPDTKKLTTTE